MVKVHGQSNFSTNQFNQSLFHCQFILSTIKESNEKVVNKSEKGFYPSSEFIFLCAILTLVYEVEVLLESICLSAKWKKQILCLFASIS